MSTSMTLVMHFNESLFSNNHPVPLTCKNIEFSPVMNTLSVTVTESLYAITFPVTLADDDG